jgi:anion-transporting  ArsA/GET3 family ATPase
LAISRGYFAGGRLFPAPFGKNPPVRDLLDKRLVFVTGKGGVGKSTISIALGLAAAARGKRAIICEIASQENASRVFKKGEVGFHEVEVANNLWAISIDPDESLREYLLIQLRVRAMRDLLVRSRIFNYLAAATPGLKELVTIGKIWELAQPERKVKKAREYDIVIVDAPATGHGIGFLQTPRTFANIARVGPIHNQAQALDSYITNHRKTGVAIVSIPEEMPVNESAHLEQQLSEEIGISVDRIYMNALYPERFTHGEADELERALEAADGAPKAAIRAALSEYRRANSQREQLERLEEAVSTPIKILPFIFKPTLDVEELRWLSGAAA